MAYEVKRSFERYEKKRFISRSTQCLLQERKTWYAELHRSQNPEEDALANNTNKAILRIQTRLEVKVKAQKSKGRD